MLRDSWRNPPALTHSDPAWDRRSLPEVHGTIAIPVGGPPWKKMLAFAGPGYLVAVGYMDPGNWATDIAGGAKFGYTLLSVIMLSNFMAILLQSLVRAARDRQRPRPGSSLPRFLLQAHRPSRCGSSAKSRSPPATLPKCSGAAIALQLLFGIPLLWGVCLTATDVFLVLYLQNRGFRYVEAIVLTLILGIAGCFAIELWMARPDPVALAAGVVPQRGNSAEPGDALHLDRHPRRDGDAA